jgi:hypothetical protein
MALALEEFIVAHPPQIATVWEWGRSADYAYLHSRDWIGEPYARYLKVFKPNLYNLTFDKQKIITPQMARVPVFEVCWDQLYIQKYELPGLLKLYPEKSLEIIEIPNSKQMIMIKSLHCLP